MTKKYFKIDNHKLFVFGLQGSGKTYFSREVVKANNYTVLVWGAHKHDFEGEPDNFILYNEPHTKENFEEFIRLAKEMCKKKVIDGVFIDEFDMLFKSNFDIGDNFNDIVLNHRHYNMFLIGISRRPQDVPAKIRESARHTVCFALDSPNAKKVFNDLYKGMGDQIGQLQYEKHECLYKTIGKTPEKL